MGHGFKKKPRDWEHRSYVGLAWATMFNRCRARVEPNPSGYWGRCELMPHTQDVDHALERGMEVLRWSTRWTHNG